MISLSEQYKQHPHSVPRWLEPSRHVQTSFDEVNDCCFTRKGAYLCVRCRGLQLLRSGLVSPAVGWGGVLNTKSRIRCAHESLCPTHKIGAPRYIIADFCVHFEFR
jgi:hypothetical protein